MVYILILLILSTSPNGQITPLKYISRRCLWNIPYVPITAAGCRFEMTNGDKHSTTRSQDIHPPARGDTKGELIGERGATAEPKTRGPRLLYSIGQRWALLEMTLRMNNGADNQVAGGWRNSSQMFLGQTTSTQSTLRGSLPVTTRVRERLGSSLMDVGRWTRAFASCPPAENAVEIIGCATC